MKKKTNDPTKTAVLGELARIKRELERCFTRDELLKDQEYALACRLFRWLKALPPAPEPPRPVVLVTVSGGVATVWDHPAVETHVVDWDRWDTEDPTPEDLAELRDVAARLRPADRRALLAQIKELEE